MSGEEEKLFADLVSRQAPAARDPMFRLNVLERRETRQFQRRSWLFVAIGLGALVLAVLWASLRPASVDAAAVVLFGIGLSALGFFFAPVLLQRLPRIRR